MVVPKNYLRKRNLIGRFSKERRIIMKKSITKKMTAVMAAAIIAGSLTACGGSDTKETSTTAVESTEAVETEESTEAVDGGESTEAVDGEESTEAADGEESTEATDDEESTEAADAANAEASLVEDAETEAAQN